jgi:hypothetical protein
VATQLKKAMHGPDQPGQAGQSAAAWHDVHLNMLNNAEDVPKSNQGATQHRNMVAYGTAHTHIVIKSWLSDVTRSTMHHSIPFWGANDMLNRQNTQHKAQHASLSVDNPNSSTPCLHAHMLS